MCRGIISPKGSPLPGWKGGREKVRDQLPLRHHFPTPQDWCVGRGRPKRAEHCHSPNFTGSALESYDTSLAWLADTLPLCKGWKVHDNIAHWGQAAWEQKLVHKTEGLYVECLMPLKDLGSMWDLGSIPLLFPQGIIKANANIPRKLWDISVKGNSWKFPAPRIPSQRRDSSSLLCVAKMFLPFWIYITSLNTCAETSLWPSKQQWFFILQKWAI